MTRYLLTLALVLLAAPCFAVFTRTYTVCESGCDYTSVAAAESAIQQDLVANDSAITFEIQNTWTSADALWAVIGWTPDATRFLTITTVGDARATAAWSTTAYRVVSALNAAGIFEAFTVIDGLQFELTATDEVNRRAVDFDADAPTFINNIIQCNTTDATLKGFSVSSSSATNGVIRNNVIFDALNVGMELNFAINGSLVDNNTFENCGIGISTANKDAAIRNNIFMNVTTPISGTPRTDVLSEENWTDNASITYTSCGSCGTGDQLSQSDPFVSLAGEDYNLASGSTPIDAGKDLSGAFTDAIGGKTRDANFDKGADEFIAVAGGPTKIYKKVKLQKVKI